MFIAFEGIDGVGKSTQVDLLADYLRRAGRAVEIIRDPGTTPLGDRLRALVLDPSLDVPLVAQTLLFTAARAAAMTRIIPALLRGAAVIADRWTLSTVAYQHYGLGMDRETILQLDGLVNAGHWPSLYILLDGDPVQSRARIAGRPPHLGDCTAPAAAGNAVVTRSAKLDRFEQQGLDFHNRLRAGYRDEYLRRNPFNITMLDAAYSPPVIHDQVLLACAARVPGFPTLVLDGN